MEFTDRYKALGIPYPDPKTMCKGQCEGTGIIPVYMKAGDQRDGVCTPEDEDDPELIKLWLEAEKENGSNDGWHFVCCPDCDGTGKKLVLT